MDKRKVFETLLYETEYANIADSKYIEERLSLLRKWIKDNMPTKLYRYRRCNENSISAFSKDEIWGSSYLTFNDSLECIPCYDLNKVNDIFNKEFDTEIIERNISQLKEGYLPSGIKELCSSEFINNLQNNAKQDISQKELEKQLQRLKNTLVTYISNNLSEYEKYFFTGISAAESQYMVACLDSLHQCIAKIKPTAVYRGIKMSIEDKKTIADIAKDKKIPCYQMVPQYFSSTYEIKPIDVSFLDNQ